MAWEVNQIIPPNTKPKKQNNMNLFIKKNWLYIVLGIALILLLFILFSSNRKLNEIKDRESALNAEVAKTNELYLKEKSDREKDNKEHEASLNQYDTLIKDMTAELEQKQGTVNVYFARVKRLQQAANDVRTPADTTQYAMRMDSAAKEFDMLSLKYAELEYNMGELITSQIAKDSVSQEYIKSLKLQVESVRSAYQDIFTKYGILQKDYAKTMRKAKGAKFLNRVLSGAVLATGGILILK